VQRNKSQSIKLQVEMNKFKIVVNCPNIKVTSRILQQKRLKDQTTHSNESNIKSDKFGVKQWRDKL
jgi:hypothetical protein